ncbi:MAG: 16S rRNA (guanine(966)-N(2))-methyltransferase RsmD [candidate division NC10 bacterium]|nr:16S rRNA (guanine(966)-N(2))-methyltransferase RsmD [candidate division NC10 bacterium]
MRGRLRIVGGAWRGRRLRVPSGPDIRPTSDFLREALFDILADRVEGADVLDLYAGTGALALEALSRGAATATLVEVNPACLRAARENAAALGCETRCRFLQMGGRAAVVRLGRQGRRFHLILADPPYGSDLAEATLRAVARYEVLLPGGFLVLEVSSRAALPERLSPLVETARRRHGGSALCFYTAEAPEGQTA